MSARSSITKGGAGLVLAATAVVAAAAVGVVAIRNATLDTSSDAAIESRAMDGTVQASGSFAKRSESTYIVVYRDEPLATYRGGVTGLAAPARTTSRTRAGSGRLAVKSAEARAYVGYLEGRQLAHENRISALIGRQLRVERRMQHAVNAAVVRMTAAEAVRVGRLSDVKRVVLAGEHEIDTDTGPTLIGAPALWNAAPSGFKGEGVVFGIIDTGINFGSPSFAATDGDGYTHANPLGVGSYLGTCAAGGVDAGRCNDKLIGGYDFVCGPPTNGCVPANREEPGFGDTNGHGSHTASTAAGNFRTAQFRGGTVRISGVAPHGNIVAFDTCYTQLSTGRGLCPDEATLAAVNQAVSDGVVDVINYSIGGGASPWDDVVSQAFLNAADAGIYVATSAGNSGPGPNSMGHHEPWTGNTAAAQHGRGDYGFQMRVTGPVPVPAGLTAINLSPGTGGVNHTTTIPDTTPLIVSPGIDTGADGCTAFAAGTFQGGIAVVRRGATGATGCTFTTKVNNAAAAGAIAVVIANNAAGTVSPSVPGATVPAFAVTQASGNALRDFAAASTGETATIPTTLAVIPNTADQLAAFSSRGPAGAYDVVKPDVVAPGVNILATIAGTTISGSENAVGLLSGTSMASPHHAGAAGLLRQAKPTWTVAEIKSALMMTAKQEVLKENGTTQASPHDMGAGRIQVDQAIKAGLVLNETKANFLAANPATASAATDGDVSTLNLASMAKYRCPNACTFTRTFRNTLSTRQSWTAKLQGVTGTVSPSLFSLDPGESKSVKVTVVSGQATDGSFKFGKLVLAPQGGVTTQPILRLPIAVRPPVAVSVPSTPLQNGVGVSGLSGAVGTTRYYTLEVPAGRTSLVVATAGGTGDVDLSIGRFPDGPYVCTSAGATNDENCSVNGPGASTWYIRIDAFSAYSGLTVTATHN